MKSWTYLLANARKDDEEGDKERTEADVDENISNVLNGGRSVHGGVEHWAAIVAEGVEPAAGGAHVGQHRGGGHFAGF